LQLKLNEIIEIPADIETMPSSGNLKGRIMIVLRFIGRKRKQKNERKNSEGEITHRPMEMFNSILATINNTKLTDMR
jgi:hypothetical protein